MIWEGSFADAKITIGSLRRLIIAYRKETVGATPPFSLTWATAEGMRTSIFSFPLIPLTIGALFTRSLTLISTPASSLCAHFLCPEEKMEVAKTSLCMPAHFQNTIGVITQEVSQEHASTLHLTINKDTVIS